MYKWIKLVDVLGERYDFEECEMEEGPFSVIVYYTAPLGIVKKKFIKKNLISIETLKGE